MKKSMALLIVGCMVSAAFAAETPVWKAEFEGQFPGEAPKGWSQMWGKKIPADLKQISNMEVLNGGGSLLMERSGTDSAQWGFGTELKDIADGRAVLTIPFQMQGSGGRALNLGFEIFSHPYIGSSRIVTLSLLGGKVTVMDGKWNKAQNIGSYDVSKWYRIVLKLPTLGGKQTDAIARLDKYEENGKWTVGKEFSVEIGVPKGKWGWILMVPNPESKFKAYFDDITFSREG